jgi:anaerobic C4-dicarboxylate transporter
MSYNILPVVYNVAADRGKSLLQPVHVGVMKEQAAWIYC